jgi:hypothetical protein
VNKVTRVSFCSRIVSVNYSLCTKQLVCRQKKRSEKNFSLTPTSKKVFVDGNVRTKKNTPVQTTDVAAQDQPNKGCGRARGADAACAVACGYVASANKALVIYMHALRPCISDII